MDMQDFNPEDIPLLDDIDNATPDITSPNMLGTNFVDENNQGQLRIVDLKNEMQDSYLEYAMSVIVSRAIPAAEDGLKPMQRRLIYAMDKENMHPNGRFHKCASPVASTMKHYHPHGSSSIYMGLVRLAQDWVVRYPLIQGQGNFGDRNDLKSPAAAERYTECRLQPLAMDLIRDIDKDTVDMVDNYDASTKEPALLPGMVPNLLISGGSGIAVGLATNIPSHNLNEIVDAAICIIDNPGATIEDLLKHVKGPDFPTGGIVFNDNLSSVYSTGHGRIIIRGKVEFEELENGRQAIIIKEVPYQVNVALLIEQIVDLVNDHKIVGISNINDEADKDHLTRIVIELKSNARPHTILNNLYRHSALQSSFGASMLALVDGKPQVLNLKSYLQTFVSHRFSVVTRRTEYELRKAQERIHILEGLIICLKNLDEVIKIIRGADEESASQRELEKRFGLTERQSKSIVDLRLGRLTRMEVGKTQNEHDAIMKEILNFKEILADSDKIYQIIKNELNQVKEKHGDARKTEIRSGTFSFNEEDLIQEEEVFVTLSQRGYVKRINLSEYKSQHRGGKGVLAAKQVTDNDYLAHSLIASTHSTMMFFTNKGRVFTIRAHEIPDAQRQSKGLPIINLIEIDQNEKVTAIVNMTDADAPGYLIMMTKKGIVKKTLAKAYATVRRNGLIAMNLEDKDELKWVQYSTGIDELLIVTRSGKSSRFNEKYIRATSRDTRGVSAMRIQENDEVAGFDLIRDEQYVLVVTENGYAKVTPVSEYLSKGRNVQGVYTINRKSLDAIGPVIGTVMLSDLDKDLMVVSHNGQVIRIPLDQLRVTSRKTKGVIIMRLTGVDKIRVISGVVDQVEAEDETELTTDMEEVKSLELEDEVQEEPIGKFIENDNESEVLDDDTGEISLIGTTHIEV